MRHWLLQSEYSNERLKQLTNPLLSLFPSSVANYFIFWPEHFISNLEVISCCTSHHCGSENDLSRCVFRVDNLEQACKQKDSAIDALNREIEELKTVQLEAPHGASPVEGDDIAKVSA